MRTEWLKFARQLTMAPADFKSGSKKIVRNKRLKIRKFNDPIDIFEIGYKNTKLTLLNKLYTHEESLSSAVEQWQDRVAGGRYGSVGFSCYNHILKPHSGETSNKRSSKMGPCLQAMTVTIIPNDGAAIDVFYRTTEILKKFPADLVYIDRFLMPRFDWSIIQPVEMTCHFANITVSSNYTSVILTIMEEDPVDYLDELAQADPQFHRSTLAWLNRFLFDNTYKFKQARRTGEAMRRLMTEERRQQLISYVRSHKLEPINEEETEDEE